jgi:sugar lactone lactonase YvrE
MKMRTILLFLIGVLIGCISPSIVRAGINNQNNSENWFTNGQPADLILGPLGFEKSGGPSFLHHPGSVATDGTRLFVADTRNNRVLIWNSIPTTNYAPADVVIGQPDFETATTRCGQRGLAWPMSVATDGKRLFVADTNNHRVLIWNSIPTTNYQPADIVLGQPDFESCDEPMEASPTTLSFPWSVETDGQRLYVADTAQARVLIWNTIPARNNQPADVVIGMPDLWSKPGSENVNAWIEANPRATLVGRGGPRGICTDGKRLAISTYGGPLKIWNSIPTKNGQPADVVLEEYKAEIEPETDGTRLFIISEQAVLIWNSWPTQDNQPPDIVVGDRWFPGLTRDRMCGPRSVATDGKRLIVADTFGNSRVLIWNQIPSENGPTPADVVLGQVDFNTNAFISRVGFKASEGICTDGTHLFAYSAEGRLLIWNSLPEENNAPANVVLGWPDFTPPPSPRWWDEYREKMGTEWIFRRTLSYGGIFSDGQRLFVVDRVRNRVLIWNTIPTKNFAPADVVLGQPNFNGGESTLPHAGRSGLNNPYDVASDGKHLFVTDSGNNRVLIWNSIPTENGQPADVVIGQPDFDTTTPGRGRAGLYMLDGVATDGKRLYVGEREGRRVLVWNSIPTQNGQPADLVLGQISFEVVLGEPGTIPEPASNMCPRGIATDGTHLFIVDSDHNRVMVWNSIPTQICQPADLVLGAPDLEHIMYSRRPSINQDRLFTPVDVAFDGQHLWVSEMKFSNRLVRFSIPKPRAVVLRAPINIKANSMTLTWSRHAGKLREVRGPCVHGTGIHPKRGNPARDDN